MESGLLESERLSSIIGAFYEVYNYYGYGLNEAVYSRALELALRDRGHRVVRELSIPVYFTRGRLVAWQRLDFVVDDRVILENKATEKLPSSAQSQLITYLHISPFQVGLLLHFGPRPAFHKFVDTNKKPHVVLPKYPR